MGLIFYSILYKTLPVEYWLFSWTMHQKSLTIYLWSVHYYYLFIFYTSLYPKVSLAWDIRYLLSPVDFYSDQLCSAKRRILKYICRKDKHYTENSTLFHPSTVLAGGGGVVCQPHKSQWSGRHGALVQLFQSDTEIRNIIYCSVRKRYKGKLLVLRSEFSCLENTACVLEIW